MITETKPSDISSKDDSNPQTPSKGENSIPDFVEKREKEYHSQEDEIMEDEFEW